MADTTKFWNRLSRLSKTLFILLLVDICLLIISLGLTAWSVSGFTALLSYFERVKHRDSVNDDPYYGTALTTSRRYSTSRSSSSRSSSYWPQGSPYTLTSYLTYSSSGAPVRSASGASVTNTISGSAYASATRSVGSSVQNIKRNYTSPTAVPSSTVATSPSPTDKVMPTSAPSLASPAFHWYSPHDDYVQLATVQVQLAATRDERSTLRRRQTTVSQEVWQEAIDIVKVFIAINSTMLAMLAVQFLLCTVFFLILCSEHRPQQKIDYRRQNSNARWFSLAVGLTSILILGLAITSVAYGSLKLLVSSGYLTLYIIFWILSGGIGIVLAVNANHLCKFCTQQLQSSTAAATTRSEAGV